MGEKARAPSGVTCSLTSSSTKRSGDPYVGLGKLATSGHLQSILQDLQAGRPMEIDAMFRVPLDLAELVQVPTPNLDLLIELATQRARAAGQYRDTSS